MRTSETINELATALAKVQGSIQDAKRDSQNPFFKSSYTSLTSVWEVCRKPLSDNNLSVVQCIDIVSGMQCLITRLMHSSGQWLESVMILNPVKNDPQSIGSAITYYKRYMLCAMVGVAPADEDDDGNQASTLVTHQTPQKTQTPYIQQHTNTQLQTDNKFISSEQVKSLEKEIGEDQNFRKSVIDILKIAKIDSLENIPQAFLERFTKKIKSMKQLIEE